LTLYFSLLTGHQAIWRAIRRLPDMGGRRTEEVAAALQAGMQRYLVTVVTVNALLGCAVGVGLFCVGMPNPALWGVMAMVVNFVPYLGSFLGVLVVGGVSLVSFPTTADAMVAPGIYLLLTIVEGQIVTPLALGSRFSIDPLLIFVWLVFWGWLWGAAGAIVASPFLMLIKLVSEMSETLRPVADFMSRRELPTNGRVTLLSITDPEETPEGERGGAAPTDRDKQGECLT
jgi:predicted PurR-regulated permease PerM